MSTFEMQGESFTYADSFPAFAHAEFCEAMDDGETVNSTRSTAVTLRLALASVAESDRGRFRQHCRKVQPSAAEVMGVFSGLLEALSDRPTMLPADSSDGRESTEVNSEPEPVASVTAIAARPERPSRPDLALALSRSGAAV